MSAHIRQVQSPSLRPGRSDELNRKAPVSVKSAPRRPLNIYGFTLLLLVIIGAGLGALSAILHRTGAPDDAVYTTAAAAGSLLLWAGVVYAATGLPLWASGDTHDD